MGQAATVSYFSGALWYLGNCYWVYPTMHVYGGIVAPAAFGILLLFCLYVGLYHAGFGALIGAVHRFYGKQAALCIVPFAWVGVELARARLTGFPWDLLGYTQVDSLALTRLAPWTGVMGLSLVVAAVNMLWLVRLRGKVWTAPWGGPALACLLVAVFTVAAHEYVPAEENPRGTALLLQENLKVGAEVTEPPETKAQMLQSFSDLSLHPAYPLGDQGIEDHGTKPDILVWPEAPNDFFDEDPVFRASLGALARGVSTPIVSDSITVAQRPSEGKALQLYNSASFFDAAGDHTGRYDKMHLVPFGEYTPFKQLFFFAGHLLDNVGPFIPGRSHAVFAAGGHRYGVFICYESIFGDEMREYARSGADMLINLSDDGWYGDSSAPWEHLDMVRMRAIENHRWVVRATNTGVTAAIDPHGRIVQQIPRHIRSSMLAGFSWHDDQTFYTRHGDWIGWLCAGVTAGLVGVGLLRKRQVD